jgi:hypothetical protein
MNLFASEKREEVLLKKQLQLSRTPLLLPQKLQTILFFIYFFDSPKLNINENRNVLSNGLVCAFWVGIK